MVLENYWFRRHEAVYCWLAGRFADGHDSQPAVVIEAGCGEGYGAQVLGRTGARVVALDYDPSVVAHVAQRYPDLAVARAELTGLPLADGIADTLVSLQVIEHLWNLSGFLAEAARVLLPGGELVVSTPNRLTFSPGLGRQQKPTNPFHVEEFDADQVAGMLAHAGLTDIAVMGLHHGDRIRAWEAIHGSIVAAHIEAVVGGSWAPALLALLPELTAGDFVIGGTADSLDLIGSGRR